MKEAVWWSLLTVTLAVGTGLAQEKQPAKQEPPTGAAPTGAAKPTQHRYNCSPEEKQRRNPVRFTELSVDRGKKLFQAYCVLCHGVNADGKGDFTGVFGVHPPDFTKPGALSQRTDGELFCIIGTGSEKMPGRHLQMSEKERWDAVNYLRAVEGKIPPKAASPDKEDTALHHSH